MATITLAYQDTTLKFDKNEWDSRAFGRDCFDLTIKLGASRPDPATVDQFLESEGIQTVTSRAPSNDESLPGFLHSLGFSFVELQLSTNLVLTGKEAPSNKLGTLRPAIQADQEEVRKIAGTAFLDTRFKCIPDLPPDKIGTRFSNWVDQIFEQHPDFAFVVEKDRQIAGFFYSQPTERADELYAALGAVSPKIPGPYGYYLYPAVMDAYFNLGVRRVVSAITADNLGALNLWAAIGAKFVRATDIFMMHK